MRIPLFIIFAVTALSGCGTTSTGESFIGKPYIQPTSTEAAAEIILRKDQNLEVVNIDAKGCYSGKTGIPHAIGEPGKEVGYRVHADHKLVLHYEGYVASEARYIGKICNLYFYFTPKKNAKYVLVTGQVTLQNENSSALAKLVGKDKGDYCTVNMTEEATDGAFSVVQLKQTRPMQKGFACIQF